MNGHRTRMPWPFLVLTALATFILTLSIAALASVWRSGQEVRDQSQPISTSETTDGTGSVTPTTPISRQAPLSRTHLAFTAHLSLKLSRNLFNLAPDAQCVSAPYLSDLLNGITAPDELQRHVAGRPVCDARRTDSQDWTTAQWTAPAF